MLTSDEDPFSGKSLLRILNTITRHSLNSVLLHIIFSDILLVLPAKKSLLVAYNVTIESALILIKESTNLNSGNNYAIYRLSFVCNPSTRKNLFIHLTQLSNN